MLVSIARELVEKLLERSDPILRHFLLIILDRFRSNRTKPTEPVSYAEISPMHANRRSVLKGEVTQKISLVHGMTRALIRNEFQLHYQLICDLSDGRIAVPVCQWVVSFPIPLRVLFAAHPELLSPLLQIIHRVIATFLIKQAGGKRSEAGTGAVTLIQRFGSAANLNIHLHCLVLGGVYRSSGEGRAAVP